MDDVGGPAAGVRSARAARAPAVIANRAVRTDGRLALHPTPVYVQRPRAMRKHVACDGADERLAGEHPRLACGLERGAPSLPGGGFWCGGFVAILLVIAACECLLDPRAGRALHPVTPCARCRRIAHVRRFNLYLGAFAAEGLINPLRHVMRFGESASIEPRNHVADFKARILDRHGEPVIGARAAGGDDVPARLEHSHDLGPKLDRECRLAGIPGFAHEAG